MKAIKSLLGPTSSEVKPRRQEEILKVLEDLKRWFSSLAESHDQLRSNPKEEVTLGRCDDPRMMESSGSMIEDPEISDPILEKKFMQNGLDEKPANKVPQDMIISSTLREFRIIGRLEREKSEAQSKFEVIRLIEENLREQAELVRRNEEKRGIIRRLQSEIKGLRAEMRTLQECLACRKINPVRINSGSTKSSLFKISRLGVMGRIFGRSLSQTTS
ncbi:hypothetical protein CDL15_Pgr014383 [Punica granatum]|uniref:NAB domain-containing protein n=1 Tax=Punica granatum TaxID=22663 RepID=A0A218WEE9_PUNGR|nr:hypothetical protein CDL15_Pgr014383 [Punica granatum]